MNKRSILASLTLAALAGAAGYGIHFLFPTRAPLSWGYGTTHGLAVLPTARVEYSNRLHGETHGAFAGKTTLTLRALEPVTVSFPAQVYLQQLGENIGMQFPDELAKPASFTLKTGETKEITLRSDMMMNHNRPPKEGSLVVAMRLNGKLLLLPCKADVVYKP